MAACPPDSFGAGCEAPAGAGDSDFDVLSSPGDGWARWAILAGLCGASCGSGGGAIARSCGFWRMRIAAAAMERTTPSTTASANHGHERRFSANVVGAKGRCPSPEPTRSTSTGATGATFVASSASSAVTGGAPALSSCSASALGTTLARLTGAALAPSVFVRVIGGAAVPRSSRRGATCTGGGLAGLCAVGGAAAASAGLAAGVGALGAGGRLAGRGGAGAAGRGWEGLATDPCVGALTGATGDAGFGSAGVRFDVDGCDGAEAPTAGPARSASDGANLSSTSATALSSARSSRSMSLSGNGGRKDLSCVTSAVRARS